MTRGTRRWIRAVAIAAICSSGAALSDARPAMAASFCTPTVLSCQPPGTCFFNNQQRIAVCNGVCQNAGGSTCHANPNLIMPCEAKQCPSNQDELFCHCET